MALKHEKYVRTLKISFILTLSMLIILFYLFPRFKRLPPPLPTFEIGQIKMIKIPRTIQKKPPAPPPLRPSIPVPSDEIEMLDELPIEVETESSLSQEQIPTSGTPLGEDELPYVPRQIIEVLPQVQDLKISGEIVLKLLIDTRGRMKTYRLVSNTTGNPQSVQRVLQAVRKSRWEVVRLGEQKVEYWITKRYRFQ